MSLKALIELQPENPCEIWLLICQSASCRRDVFCKMRCMKLLEIFVHNCTVGLSHVWRVLNIFLWSSTEGQQICQLSHMSKAIRHPLHSALNAPLLLTRVASRLFLGLNVFIRRQWHHSWKCCSHTINSATNGCDFRQAWTDPTVSHRYVLRQFLSISNFFFYFITLSMCFTDFFSIC